jgi:hypothetical protein
MLKEAEIKIIDKKAFIGVEFDELYIGRAQNWSA